MLLSLIHAFISEDDWMLAKIFFLCTLDRFPVKVQNRAKEKDSGQHIAILVK